MTQRLLSIAVILVGLAVTESSKAGAYDGVRPYYNGYG